MVNVNYIIKVKYQILDKFQPISIIKTFNSVPSNTANSKDNFQQVQNLKFVYKFEARFGMIESKDAKQNNMSYNQEIIINKQMFQNSYQNGTYFQLFDPKVSQDKMKNLFKLQNVTGNNKVFDKQLKTYVFQFNSGTAKIIFPKEDRKDLYLIQQFLNLHIYFHQEMGWNIQLSISDLNKTKRRVILSPNPKIQIKPFFIKFPCSHVQEGIWNNLIIDLYSFMSAFKGQSYRSLDSITITGFFKLRRIFTTQQPPVALANSQDDKVINLLPKALLFPLEIECSNCLITYQQKSIVAEEMSEPTEHSSKNKSNILSRKQISTPKTEIIRPDKKGYQDEKKFLADTNGPEKNKKKHQKNTSGETDKSRYLQKPAASSQKKHEKRQSNVGKSEVPKHRSSIEKKKPVKQQQKLKVKSKLNPWRSLKKNQTQTDGSQLSQTKPNKQRKTQSAQTTLFKTKNNLANKFNQSNNKGFQHRSDHYSDSQYVQLSQKFSTLTQNRFFKNQPASQHVQSAQKDPDEIEEHIELESNQMCESQNRKQQQADIIKQLKNQPIQQSISDSLDHLKDKNSFSKNGKVFVNPSMMNSYYGFGEKLMNKYMNQVQRPYSPPLCQRELTEEASQKNEPQQDKQVQLIYDPVLNCYYDHKTHTYYELKN